MGKKHHPQYRICVMEAGKPRDGAYIESLGYYDPFIQDEAKQVRLKKERAEYWLSVGAQPSETVLSFLKAEKVAGLIRQKPKKNKRPKSTSARTTATAKAKAKAKAKTGTKSRKPPKKAKKAE